MTADELANDVGRLTLACCVEYGTLEEGTLRLVESLRRFGGPLSAARVVAVTPRRGPSVRRQTLQQFDELGVDYVRIAPPNRYVWQPYLNKYFALAEAEKRATGDLVAWVDSDVIVVAPPTDLLLAANEDFGACPRTAISGQPAVTTSPPATGQRLRATWVPLADLPWVTTASDPHERIRLYWNAGIFVYRPAVNFLEGWRSDIEQLLDQTDSSTLDKAFWADQVALSFTAVRKGLRLRHLPERANYGITTHFKSHLTSDGLRTAALLHYHDCMASENWAWFMDTISAALPDAHAWLAKLGPSRSTSDPFRTAQRNAFGLLGNSVAGSGVGVMARDFSAHDCLSRQQSRWWQTGPHPGLGRCTCTSYPRNVRSPRDTPAR